MNKINQIKRMEVSHDQLELLEALEKGVGLVPDKLRVREYALDNNDTVLGLDWSESAGDFNFSDFAHLIAMEREVYYG